MPLSVLAAIAALYLLGVTFNMVSLGGLAVGIGMLVDNSIVVIESITKRRDKGEEAFESACRGTLDVAGSLFASTLTTVCVFVPILFITGLTRECFADLAYAVMLSLAFSLLVALTVIPSLYYLVCRMRKSGRGRDSGPSFASAEQRLRPRAVVAARTENACASAGAGRVRRAALRWCSPAERSSCRRSIRG